MCWKGVWVRVARAWRNGRDVRRTLCQSHASVFRAVVLKCKLLDALQLYSFQRHYPPWAQAALSCSRLTRKTVFCFCGESVRPHSSFRSRLPAFGLARLGTFNHTRALNEPG